MLCFELVRNSTKKTFGIHFVIKYFLNLFFLDFVKLHSDLRILTQLQLVGIGVDFVFPKEGRKKKKKEELTPT